jgi:hypothetical protein
MSRIYEAIRIANESKAKAGPGRSDALGEMELPDRRVTPRLDLNIDLTVYGRAGGDGPFYEHARAISGNANGGVFQLSIPVIEGQDLLLINNNTSREQICNVLSVQIRDIQTSEVSVGFPLPNPDFWMPFKAGRTA